MSSDAKVVGYCRVCGKALDETAAHPVSGALYCAEHVPPAPQEPATPPSYTAPPYHAPASPYSGNQPPPLPHTSNSPIVAFSLGLIPGVGAVYNGQYAKGLVHVIILGLIITVLANGGARGYEPLFGILIPCFWFYMAFEAYHTAKRRVLGQSVDEFSSIVPMRAGPSRFPIAPVLLIALGVLFLLSNLDIIEIRRLWRYWPALLIVLGFYLLYQCISERASAKPEVQHERQ